MLVGTAGGYAVWRSIATPEALASISSGANAIDLLGQHDDSLSAPGPVYTKVGAHGAPNRLGMFGPTDIAIDSVTHRLFVADSSNSRVLVYNMNVSNDLLDRIPDNVLGQSTMSFVAPLATTQSKLRSIVGIAYDATNSRLFVAQASSAHRVTVFDVSSITDGEDAIYVLGQSTFTGSTGATTQTGLNFPSGVAYDSVNSRLFVSQSGVRRVTVYNLADGITNNEGAINVLGQGTFTGSTLATTQNGMGTVTGIEYDSVNGRLFVADQYSNRVTVYNLADGITDGENAVSVLGQSTFTGGSNANTQAGMNSPQDVAYDAANSILYVVQNTGNRVTAYNLADGITDGENAVSVLGQGTFTANVSATTQAGMYSPKGLAYDSANARLYVADTDNNRVISYGVGSIVDGEDAIDVIGQHDDDLSVPNPVFTKGVVGDGPNKLGMYYPRDVEVDAVAHRMFVTDSGNNRVLVYDMDTGNNLLDRVPDKVLGQSGFASGAAATTQAGMNVPRGLAYDSANNRLFVSQTGPSGMRVTVYDVSAITNGEDAVNVLGNSSFTGGIGPITQAGLNNPNDVAYDSANARLFVAQSVANRVSIFDVASISDGEAAVNVLGQPTFTSSASATTQNGMMNPYGLAYDASNSRLFVSATSNNRVTVYDLSDGITDGEDAINVLGQSSFTTGTAVVTQAGMASPSGLAYDATNSRLFVAQGGGRRVTAYDVSSISNGENATHVLGQSVFTSSVASATQAGMSNPIGLFYDGGNTRLYVADDFYNRVTSYEVAPDISVPIVSFVTPATTDNLAGSIVSVTLTATDSTPNIGISLTVPCGSVTTANPASIASGATATFNWDVTACSDGTHELSATATDGVGNVSGAVTRDTTVSSSHAGTDVIGQYDDNLTAPGPVYTKGLANNVPNRLGFSQTTGVAVDTVTHRLFVASRWNNNSVIVYNLDSNNDLLDRIPDNVLGQANFYSSSEAVTQAGLYYPNSIAYDAANSRLFVAQYSGNRVSVFDVSSITNGEDAINVLGQGSFVTSAAATTQSGMNGPQDLALDPVNSRLFVCESANNRVTVYNLADGIANGESAMNVLGQSSFTVSTGATTQAGMRSPSGAAYDSTNSRLFVSQGSSANRVTVYNLADGIANGESAINVLGQSSFTVGTGATTQAGLNTPGGIAYDSANSRLFVSQGSGGNRVTVYNLADGITNGENAINVLGQSSYTTKVAAATQSGMNLPYAVAYDAANSRLYITEYSNNRVSVYDVLSITDGENAIDVLGQSDGNLTAPLPVYTRGSSHNVPNKLGLNNPNFIAIDTVNHRLFASDQYNNRVLVYDLDSNNDLPNRIPDKVIGQADFQANSYAITQTGLRWPADLEYDNANSRLFVADKDNQRVLVFNVSSIMDGEGADNVLGQPTFTVGSGATTQNGMNEPIGLAYDASNQRLFVSQNLGANRITVYDVSAISDGEDAINVLGQATFTSGSAATTQSGLYGPFDLAYDATNSRLFVAEAYNKRVTTFNVSSITDGEDAINVLGQADFTSSTIATTQVGMNYPQGLAYDSGNSRLWVAEMNSNRVTEFDVSSIADGEAATGVFGQVNFTTSTAATSSARMNRPFGLAYDSGNSRLWVAEEYNHRLLALDMGSSALAMSSAVTGDADADGKVDRVVVTFNQDLDASTVTSADFTVTSPSYTASSASETSAGVVTIVLTEGGSADTSATPTVNIVGSVQNSGNTETLASGSAVAADGAAPVVMSVSPSDGATGVPLGADIVLTFSEAMDTGFAEGTEFTVSPDPGSFTPAWTLGNTVVTLSHASDFSGSSTITVTTAEAQIAAAAGSPSALITTGPQDGDWSFTTESGDQPPVISVAVAASPSAPNVTQDVTISATFTDGIGVNEIKLFKDGTADPANVIKTCTFSPAQSPATCSETLGPQSDGSHTIRATGRDTASQTTSSDSSFTVGSFTTSGSMTLSRLKAGLAGVDFALQFALTGPDTGPLTVTFPAGFTVTQAFTSGTCSGGGTVGSFGYTSTTLTGTKTGCIGTVTLSGAQLTLHSTPGTYTVTWSNDSGSGSFTIVDDDQVTVSGQVDPTLTFDLDVAVADASSVAPYLLDFGEITPGTVASSGTAYESIWLDLSTNATGGAVVTVRNANGSDGLVSSSVPADKITNAAAAMSSASANYGICVVSVAQAAGGPLAKAGNYAAGTCAADGATNDVKALTTSNASILSTTSDPVDSGRARVSVNVNAVSTTPAHPDYADALTFIATATY